MRLLRPLAGYELLDHKINEEIRQELGVKSYVKNKRLREKLANVTVFIRIQP